MITSYCNNPMPSGLINRRVFLTLGFVSILAAATVAYFVSGTAACGGPLQGQGPDDVPSIEMSITGREWYAAPNGQPDGDGSKQAPWDLETALSGGRQRTAVNPGDVIWLRGGTYKGIFTSRLQGTADAPIYVRSHKDEWAILDKATAVREKATLSVRGGHVWFWDFEVSNSFPERGRLDPEGGMDPWRGSGINVWAPNTKYINLVIHDNGHAFGLWNEEGGTEIYGCVMFNNGNNKKEHGIYGHNKTGTQLIHDNIIFNGAGYGLHIYANSSKRSIQGFEINGNAVFNNGVLMKDDQVADQILVGGVNGSPASRIEMSENHVYNRADAPTAKNRGVRLGYEDRNNVDVRLYYNTIVSRVPLKILWWRSVEARGNTIRSAGRVVEIEMPDESKMADYKFEANRYWNSGTDISVFMLNGEKTGIPGWQKIEFNRVAPVISEEQRVFIRPNRYESGRANVIVYNWKLERAVSVDLNSVLRPGDKFKVLDAQNYFGDPVIEGTFNGRPILLPMRLTKTALPIGNVERIPEHTSPEFGVFVVRKG